MTLGDWYQNITIKQLEKYIDQASSLGNHVLGQYIGMDKGSPSHGQLINSQLAEDGYSVYWDAEIITKASDYIIRNCCPKYNHTIYTYISVKKKRKFEYE